MSGIVGASSSAEISFLACDLAGDKVKARVETLRARMEKDKEKLASAVNTDRAEDEFEEYYWDWLCHDEVQEWRKWCRAQRDDRDLDELFVASLLSMQPSLCASLLRDMKMRLQIRSSHSIYTCGVVDPQVAEFMV